MTEPIKTVGNISASTYQSMDGSNFTVTGIEEKYKLGKGYASAFVGAATNFKDDGMFVVDLKGGYNYDKNGIFNQNLRIRNKMGKNTESTQIRYSPLTVDFPVGKNTNIYVKLVEEEKDPQPPVEELPEQEPSDEEKDETPATGVANYIGIAIAVIAVSSIVIISLKKKNA